jgi:hypothetical protein
VAGAPSKRCSQCGTNTARAYHWWLEETSIRFVCVACRGLRPVPAAEPRRPAPLKGRVSAVLDDPA